MKRIIILSFCFIMIGISSIGQVKFGVKAGLPITVNKFEIDSVKLEASRPFNAGLSTEFIIPKLGLGLELSGLFELSQLTILELSKEINSGYILIPMNIKWKLGPKKVKFYVFAGPQLGLKLYDSEVIKIEESYLQINRDIEFEPKPLNWSINAGVGIELFKTIQIGVTYFYDFDVKYNPLQNVTSASFKKQNGCTLALSIFF